MPTYEVYESRKPLEVPPDIYDATVSKVEEVDGQYGPQVKLSFDLPGYPDETPLVWASAKKEGMGTGTKLFKIACALLGEPPAVGGAFNTDLLVGRPCRLVIGEKETTNGVVLAVLEILRPKAAPKAAAPVSVKQKPLEGAPVAKPGAELADACYCGAPAFTYTEDGAARCEEHAGAGAENLPFE